MSGPVSRYVGSHCLLMFQALAKSASTQRLIWRGLQQLGCLKMVLFVHSVLLGSVPIFFQIARNAFHGYFVATLRVVCVACNLIQGQVNARSKQLLFARYMMRHTAL